MVMDMETVIYGNDSIHSMYVLLHTTEILIKQKKALVTNVPDVKARFIHRYGIQPDIHEAMRTSGVKDSCPPYRQP